MTINTISVPGIHCDHCKAAIEGALTPHRGVHSAVVDVAARTVTVDFDEAAVDRADLVRTIEEQGYEVSEQP